MFKITAATVAASNTGYKVECIVKVEMPADEWKITQRMGHLGALYGVDISNEVYRISNRLVPAHNPMVDDSKRAKNGIKYITLTYHYDDVESAHRLGLECHKTTAGLEPKWSSYVNLLDRKLKLVSNG